MKLENILLITGIFMTTLLGNPSLISHKHTNQLNLENIQKRLKSASHLTFSPENTLKLLDELSQFELGRFLLKNQGLNGYWTSYIISHGPKQQQTSELEKWLLNKAPVVKATQERFHIFQTAIQARLKNSMTLASIPCGLMDDLITLDYTQYDNISLVGIDLDPESIQLAQVNALAIKPKTTFMQKNAWELNTYDTYDLITSNGLNIYEPDDNKVIQLYKGFLQSLKSKGILITSFLTPPPTASKESTWKNINAEDLNKQKAIFADIIQAKWQTFRTETQVRSHLESAGFKIVQVIYDTQGMFPTIIAEKP